VSVDDVVSTSSTSCCQLSPASSSRDNDVRLMRRELDNDGRSLPVSTERQTFQIIITVNLLVYSAFLSKNPKRAACASLIEREEKGFVVGTQ